MIKIYSIILINLLFISCIDLITEEEFYESIHLKQSGWLEFYENNIEQNISLGENFTFQLWFSGQDATNLDASCILNINSDSLNLSIYKNQNAANHLMIYINETLYDEIEIENIDLNNENNFYLLSVIIENQTMTIYFNSTLIFEESINEINDSQIIVGALKIENSISNLWHGYVDEIRLWNDALTSDIIEFHNQYPYKVSSSYDDEYLDYLVGLWDFKINTVSDKPDNIFQDINQNDLYTIIYTLESMSNELSTNGR